MKPHLHSKNSAKKYGGQPEEYQHIHDWIDQTKMCLPDMRHRALLHSAFGVFLLEQVFGKTMTNSVGKVVSIRDLGEDHVLEDLGFIPTVERWFKNMPMEDWMSGTRRKQVHKFEPLSASTAQQILSEIQYFDSKQTTNTGDVDEFETERVD